MYFTREAQTSPEETEANRTGGVTTVTTEQANDYDPGVIARVFSGAPGEPFGNDANKLLRNPALSSKSNTGICVIAFSRAQQTDNQRLSNGFH